MSDPLMPPTDEVGSLLADRERIQGWLARLDGVVGSKPEAVGQRVRTDYERRLADVVTRLDMHRASLSATLAAASAELAEREAERSGLEDTLAEAELRHAVGEYTRAQWDALATEQGARLDALAAGTGTLREQVVRTTDLLARITASGDGLASASAAPALTVATIEVVVSDEPPPSATPPERALQVEVDRDGIPVFERPEPGVRRLPEPVIMHAPLEAPKFKPSAGAAGPSTGAARPIQFPVLPGGGRPRRDVAPSDDEMAFLRSVTADAPPARPRGPAAATPSAERTLQCADCGAMNPPHEWYCDQCGGELTAL